HNLTHLLQELMDPWTRAVVRKAVTKSPTGRDDPVRKSWSLGDEVDHVHPEAVDATVEPPAHHVVDRGPDLWVLPVQIGLLGGEQVQVVLAGGLVQSPGRTREERLPVVRLSTRCTGLEAVSWSTPDVPVAFRVVERGSGLDEPRMLGGGVVDDQVHDELHPALVHLLEQLVEFVERAEDRVDVVVVADVVAVVSVRGAVDR